MIACEVQNVVGITYVGRTIGYRFQLTDKMGRASLRSVSVRDKSKCKKYDAVDLRTYVHRTRCSCLIDVICAKMCTPKINKEAGLVLYFCWHMMMISDTAKHM